MKFEVDFMLGKLARTLRILGFDTKYVKYVGANSRSPLQLLSEAMKEGRILLTRAHNFPKTENIFVIESEQLETQLKELDDKFKIKSKIAPFSRCLVCNTSLVTISKSEAKGKVPFYVYETHDEFSYCRECHKFYWEGTHYQAMVDFVTKLLNTNV